MLLQWSIIIFDRALPIFMLSLVPPAGAVLISCTFLVLFGEIIPQSICSG